MVTRWRSVACIALFFSVTGLSEAAREIRVGIYENPPKLFIDTSGMPAGILIEVLDEIAAREGWQLSYVRCEWLDCLHQLQSGEIDLMPDVALDETRATRFDFHRKVALHSWSQVFRRADVDIGSVLDLSDKRIAILGGSIQESELDAWLGGFDVRHQPLSATTYDEAFRLAASGAADAAIANHQFGAHRGPDYGLVETPIVFMPARLFYATAKGRNAELLDRIDVHLERWQADPGSVYFEIIRNWGGRVPEPLVPTSLRNALGALLALGVLLGVGILVLRRQVRAKTEELVRLNRQLSATLDAIPDLLFEVDREGRYLDFHATRPDHLLMSPDQFVGKTVNEVLPPAAAAICLDALREADARGWAGGFQFNLPLADGPTWFELSVAKKEGDAPDFPHFIVLSRDVTARRSAEERAQRMSRLYATLSQCNQAIVRCQSQQELLDRICREAVVHGGMKMAWIGLLDESDDLVKPVAIHGEGTEYLRGIRIGVSGDDPSGKGPTGTAVREDRPVWCQDFSNDPMTAPWHERGRLFGWGSSAALPLHRDGVVIGVMSLYSGEVNAFDDEAKNLLVEMACDIDFALERFRENAERMRLAAEVVESEEKYRELTESVNDVIWTLDPESLRFLYISPSVVRLCGYTPEESMARPLEEAFTPTSAARLRHLIAANLADFATGRRTSEDFTVEEVEQPCKDGSTVWTEVVANVVRNSRTGKVEIRGVTRDISERKRAEARIQNLAYFDQLTGLPNRMLLKDRFVQSSSHAQRTDSRMAVMFLDLDHFKNVNDSLGHEIGDQLLVEVARRLEAALRAGDTVCRLGGDEFIFVLPDTDAEGAARVATKLLDIVSRPCLIGKHELRTTPSIGVAVYPDDGTDLDTLSRNADAAMYQVKREGRNDLRFFTREMQAHSSHVLLLATALYDALERGELSVHYQPKLSLVDGRIIGAEALVRWQHSELGTIPPSEFIPIAESNGLIVQLGEWVLRRAATQARLWESHGLPPLVVSVNLSAAQFRQPDLAQRVMCILEESGLPPERLELELTEAAAMNDPESAARIMDELFACGIRMSIDDFGTGYSSLSYLKRFKAGTLKIDKSFVQDVTEDADDKAIVIAIINLARSLGMKTIAEGVETAGQLEFLREQGCDAVQGYHFSRPLPLEAFEAYVRALDACPT